MKRILSFIILSAAAAAITACSQDKRQGTAAAPTAETQEVQEYNTAPTADTGAADGKVSYLTTAEFKKRVMDYDKHPGDWVFEGSRPAVIDFYATWCRPCKMTAPVVEALAKDYRGKIDFYKVDIDKERELAETFGIQSIPTFLFIPMNGKPTAQTGAMQKADFEALIKSVVLK